MHDFSKSSCVHLISDRIQLASRVDLEPRLLWRQRPSSNILPQCAKKWRRLDAKCEVTTINLAVKNTNTKNRDPHVHQNVDIMLFISLRGFLVFGRAWDWVNGASAFHCRLVSTSCFILGTIASCGGAAFSFSHYGLTHKNLSKCWWNKYEMK